MNGKKGWEIEHVKRKNGSGTNIKITLIDIIAKSESIFVLSLVPFKITFFFVYKRIILFLTNNLTVNKCTALIFQWKTTLRLQIFYYQTKSNEFHMNTSFDSYWKNHIRLRPTNLITFVVWSDRVLLVYARFAALVSGILLSTIFCLYFIDFIFVWILCHAVELQNNRYRYKPLKLCNSGVYV